jgi:hypothetical protein
VCALGHKLEELGFSTVALASIRVQAEKTRPPRALWTAAPMGRPVGEPSDPAFQTRVLKAALALLERTDGPVILEDFPEDPTGLRDTTDWLPLLVPLPGVYGMMDAWRAELAALMPFWNAARQRFGRTSVGLSRQEPEAWPEFVSQVLAGRLPVVSSLGTPALSVRFLCDDVKALYGEAAQSEGPKPSPMQLDAWFWRQTVAAAVLRALRTVAMASENNGLKTVGGRFFVPTPWVD